MRHPAQTGMAKLEFAISVAIFGVLAAVLLERLSYVQESAEKVHMEATASALRSALFLKIAEHMTSGRTPEYEKLAQENPMDWLERKPPNYAGAFTRPPYPPPDGSWYFDKTVHILTYQVNLGRHFQPDALGLKQVQFYLKLQYGEAPPTGDVGDSPMPASGIKLVAIQPYRWFEK